MKKTIVIIITSILFIEGCAEPAEKSKLNEKDSVSFKQSTQLVLLDKVIAKYNNKSVLFSVYSLEKEVFKKTYSNISGLKLGVLFQNNSDSVNHILLSFENELMKTSIENQKDVLKKIDEWNSLYFMFNSLVNMNYKAPVYAEEIIFELPETKHLFKNYIENPAQDWGSLDVSQISEVYFDFIKYMVDIDTSERIKIISKFVSFIQTKQKSRN